MRTVTVSIDSFGNTKMDANGFVGTSCEDATSNLIHVLGGKKTDDEKKPEYSMPNNTGVTQSW